MTRLKLRLESEKYGNLDLSSVFDMGVGVEALSGATGLGLPSVSNQWLAGAGHGSTFRGQRVGNRVIDLPILVTEATRDKLKNLWDKLSLMLSAECVLRFVEEDGSSWSTTVIRSGGGGYTFGEDTTGEDDLLTVVTLEAGDPFWTSSNVMRKKITTGAANKGLLSGGSLVQLDLSASQAIGTMTLRNPGTAPAYPTWTVQGPGHGLHCAAVGPDGVERSFTWNGSLDAGETLTITTRPVSVLDQAGENRYAEMAPAPKFWPIPPGGITTATVEIGGADAGTVIICEYRPRSWAVL